MLYVEKLFLRKIPDPSVLGIRIQMAISTRNTILKLYIRKSYKKYGSIS